MYTVATPDDNDGGNEDNTQRNLEKEEETLQSKCLKVQYHSIKG